MAIRYVIGVDEVGRGPIAGPVTIGAVLVPKTFDFDLFAGVRDSKKLSPNARREWFEKVHNLEDLTFTTASVGPELIDRRGIVWALRTALRRALFRFDISPDECEVLLDGGLKAPPGFTHQRTITGGDDSVPIIALASIVAKVTRDRKMSQLAHRYPGYAFERHKGYGTKKHYLNLKERGLCGIHRKSFCRV
jgi:ribonuclease HII